MIGASVVSPVLEAECPSEQETKKGSVVRIKSIAVNLIFFIEYLLAVGILELYETSISLNF